MLIPFQDEDRPPGIPLITFICMGVSIVVFLLMPGRSDPAAYVRALTGWGTVPRDFNPLTLFTAQFMHADIWHLGGNMLFLWIFGPSVEDRLGRLWFAGLYLLCGVAGALPRVIFDSHSMVPGIGASGAIMGVMGAYVALIPKGRITFFAMIWYRPMVFTLPAILAVGYYLLLDLLGSMLPSEATSTDHFAHLGGMAVGFGLGLWTRKMTAAPTVLRLGSSGERSARRASPEDARLVSMVRRTGHTRRGTSRPLAPDRADVLASVARNAPAPTAASGENREELAPFEIPYMLPLPERPGAAIGTEHDPARSFNDALASEDPASLATVVIRVGRGGRRILVEVEAMFAAAERLLEAGHLALAAELLGRITAGAAGASAAVEERAALAADADLQLAWLYSDQLGDPPLARFHAGRALARGLADDGEQAARRLLAGLPPQPATPTGRESCTLMRLSSERLDLKRVSDAIARRVDRPALDVQGEIKLGMGILARDLTLADAETLRDDMLQLGVAVVVVASPAMHEPPEPDVLREIEVGTSRLCGVTRTGRELTMDWSEVLGGAAHWRLASRSQASMTPAAMEQRQLTEDMSKLGMRTSFSESRVSATTARLDLFIRGSARPELLRVVQGSTHIRFTGGQKVIAAAQSMLLASSALVARADRLHLGPGVLALAGISDPAPFECGSSIQESAFELVAMTRLELAGRTCAGVSGTERIRR